METTGSTRWKTLVLLASGCIFPTFAAAQAAVDCRHTATCASSGSVVSEVPEGVIDGRNTKFRMRHVPSNDAPLTFFRNGLALVRGADYQVSDQMIVTSTLQTPAAGDVLRAVYTPNLLARPKAAASRSTSNPGAATVNSASDIAYAAARAALLTEESQATKLGQASTSAFSRGPFASPAAHSRISDPESLRMLSEDMGQSPAPIKKHKAVKGITLQGVDGLGDGFPEFNEERQSPSNLLGQNGGFSNAQGHQSVAAQRTSDPPSAAVELLQNRLESADAGEHSSASVKSHRKIHNPKTHYIFEP